MPDRNSQTPPINWQRTTFEGARREQLCRWAELPLEDILRALEEMEDLSRQLGTAPADESSGSAQGLIIKESSGVYGASDADDLALAGCTPEPLMAYLKALGVLRLVNEQKDPGARGWWKNDVFWLRSPLLFNGVVTEEAKRDALTKFFLEEYRPTPIFCPWNGDGGFLSDTGTSVDAIKTIRESSLPRLKSIRDAITKVERIPLMAEFREKRDRSKELEKKKKELKKQKLELSDVEEKERKQLAARVKQIKQSIVNEIRAGFPDGSLNWLDACMTLNTDGFTTSPLLGTGGLDGRLDFGTNFLVNVQTVLNGPPEAAPLRQALFGNRGLLAESAIGQFSPGQIGGPNATQGFEGNSLINLWDFILMMEGSLLLAGAAVRRFGVSGKTWASFPFTVRAVAAGFDSSAKQDEVESRGELWVPLWTRPTNTSELRQLFGEGRAEVSGRPARTGTDFARAIAGLGVDRGIAGFTRLVFLKRSGKAFLATSMGRFAVTERHEADLLRQVDPWLNAFRQAAGDKNAPPRFGSSLRRIDSAIFDFCKYGGPAHFQQILIALGQAERELTIAERFREEKQLKPLASLSRDWIEAADDGSAEFQLVRALASLDDAEGKIGPLRANLEAVDWKRRYRAWAEKDRAVVWNAVDLATNLANVLQRRVMDGQRAGCRALPLASNSMVPLETIAAFLEADLDDQRIEVLLWGLALIEQRSGPNIGQPIWMKETNDRPIPRTYALLKLLFLPRLLVGEPYRGEIRWRLAREGEAGIAIRPEPRILPLLRAGRIGEACRIAAQRLRVSGLSPIPGALPDGRTRDDAWSELTSDPRRAQRLAASLLIPIDSASVNRLVHLVCRDELALTAT